MKREYVILGSNNFWYASNLRTINDALKEMEKIKKNPKDYGIPGNNQSELPNSLYIYRVSLIKELHIKDC